MVTPVISKPTHGAEAQRLLFSSYREYGFDGLQLKGNQYGDYLEDGAAGADRFRNDWGDDPGHVASLITMNPLDDAGVVRLQKLITFAAAVGSPRVVLCHDIPRDTISEADLARLAGQFSDLGEAALRSGVQLSLHHHFNEPVMHRRDFEVFFGAVRPGTVKLTVDTGHLMKSMVIDLPGLISDFAPVIDNVHLKDYADGRFRLLGRGDVDLPQILAAIDKLGPDCSLCVDEESSADIVEGLTVSRDYLAANWTVH
jgi:inosose dehydratase